MTTELEDLNRRAMDLLRMESSKKPELIDLSKLEQLAKLPGELQRMGLEARKLGNRQSQIKSLLETIANNGQGNGSIRMSEAHGGNVPKGDICIHVNRSMLDLPGGALLIRERWDADTLVHFLKLLHGAFGNPVLEKLSKLQVNRGALVSCNPSEDYKYYTHRGRTKVYAHKPIPGTSYYVLTNNSCDEKIDCIEAVSKFLNLPIGSVKVEKIIPK